MAYDYKDNMPANCDLSVYAGEDTILTFQWSTKEVEGSDVLTPVDITGSTSYLTIGKLGLFIQQFVSSTADETGVLTFTVDQEAAVLLLDGAFKVKKLDYDLSPIKCRCTLHSIIRRDDHLC